MPPPGRTAARACSTSRSRSSFSVPRSHRRAGRPQFIDYLYLALTCSTAFSPTDVMPLTPRAKITMGCQSLISLAVVGLVVARAVNVLN